MTLTGLLAPLGLTDPASSLSAIVAALAVAGLLLLAAAALARALAPRQAAAASAGARAREIGALLAPLRDPGRPGRPRPRAPTA